MFCYAYVHQHPGWNQNSRLDLLHALFVHKTFKIDAYHENTGDKSIANGHYYSDKAPGIVFLAMPAFVVSAGILDLLDVPLDSPKGWFVSDWITTAGSVGLITALGGVAMFAFLCRLVEQRFAFLTTYVVFLGAAPFPYATMLFSHAAVIGLICIALWAIADPFFWSRMIRSGTAPEPLGGWGSTTPSPQGGSGTRVTRPSEFWLRRYALAGFCCGLAISSEYPSAIAAGGILALALLTSFKRGGVLALAAIPALLLIPLYNWTCFGGPFAFGYHHLALTEFQEMNKGLFGITLPPKASAAYLILFSPERGLLFWTPFFFISIFALKSLSRTSKNLFWASCLTIALQIACISGYYMPDGGSALGPRHLAPMLPFLIIPAALALRQFPFLGLVLGYYSILLTGFATLIEAMPHPHPPNPLLMVFFPKLLRSEIANNIGTQLGLQPYLSLCLAATILMGAFFLACLRTDRRAENKRAI